MVNLIFGLAICWTFYLGFLGYSINKSKEHFKKGNVGLVGFTILVQIILTVFVMIYTMLMLKDL